MRLWTALGAAVIAAFSMAGPAPAALQTPMLRTVDEKVLREYTGVYQWGPNAFVYLQMWNEFTGFTKPSQLVAFDESGDIRTLYPTDADRFFAGPGAAIPASIESRVEFQRDSKGKISSLQWTNGSAAPRTARRVDTEKHEDVRFANGDVEAGRYPDQSIDAWKAPRDDPRSWFRCRKPSVRAPLRALPNPPGHDGPRVRQARRRRIDRGLEYGVVRRSRG